jgi:DNA (cytosine-5)-methyltransferase 1
MEALRSDITVTDMFCGAGGSSTGAVAAGATVRLAMNHSRRALETHNLNHPNTTHVLADVSQANPYRYPPTDILIASPECTNHTLAQGVSRREQAQLGLWEQKAPDPAAERSRCTMWDPLRFAEVHHYPLIILENVVDIRRWVMFEAWLHAWKSLDYAWEFVYFNSQFAHPTPQSRDRLYVVLWKRKNRKPDLALTPLAYCSDCGKDQPAVQSWKNPLKKWGKYGRGGQYVYCCPECTRIVTPYYYAAASAIDFSLPAERIGDRKQPLEENTLRRIETGLAHFIHPFLLQLNKSNDRYTRLDEPLPTQTTTNGLGIVLPFIVELHGTSTARMLAEPLSTVCAGGNHQGLVLPKGWWLNYNSNGQMHPLSEPLGTQPTKDRFALVQPGATPTVEDCSFRMLTPEEIKTAMAFPKEYVITGTKKEQIWQLGNALTPPVMKLLMQRVLAALDSKTA